MNMTTGPWALMRSHELHTITYLDAEIIISLITDKALFC